MSEILEINNLTHIYENSGQGSLPAIENISFSIEKGEIIGIIGHTGSGKSTLVQHLNGLLKPTSGTVFFNGKDIWENKNLPVYLLYDNTVI